MKNLLTVVLLSMASAALWAEPLTTEQLQIRAMIAEIKEAPEAERYQKMNAFKEQIRSMNGQARQEAIKSLQLSLETKEALQTQTQIRTNEGNGKGEQVHMRTQLQEQHQLQEAQQQLQMQNQVQNRNQMGPQGGRSGRP